MSSCQLISPAPSFLGWLLLRENLILPPADLVSEKRKRIGRIRPLQRHKPAPDHEIAIALFGQSRQGGTFLPEPAHQLRERANLQN